MDVSQNLVARHTMITPQTPTKTLQMSREHVFMPIRKLELNKNVCYIFTETNSVGTFGMCETRTCFMVSIEDDIVIEGTQVLHVSLETSPDLLGKIDFRDGNITVMDDDG